MARKSVPVETEERPGTDLEPVTIRRDDLAEIKTVEEMLAFLQGTYGELTAAHELGDGFTLLDDKARLVGVPFVIIDTHLQESSKFRNADGVYAEYVTALVMVLSGPYKDTKLVVNDGSTGMAQQLIAWRNRTGRNGGFMCHRGLRVSEYDYEAPDGSVSEARTYYIDESGI